jgi:hypothetical protein
VEQGATKRAIDAAVLLLLVQPATLLLGGVLQVGVDCASVVNVYDVRLVNYFLEWGMRAMSGLAQAQLWSPPFFFPDPGALAFSETFLSGVLFYAPFRHAGLSPNASLLAFQVLQLALSPCVAYLCARRLGFSWLPAAVGGLISGWAWVRFHQLSHIQFAAGWVIPLFFALVWLALEEKRPLLLAAAAWVFAWTWFVCVYLCWFLIFVGCGVALLATLAAPKATLQTLVVFSRSGSLRERVAAVVLLSTAIALVGWGVWHYWVYLDARATGAEEALIYAPQRPAWFQPDARNLLWGRFHGHFPSETEAPWEKQLYLGWLLLGCVLICGIWALRPIPGEGEQARLRRITLGSIAWLVPIIIEVFSLHQGRLRWMDTVLAFLYKYIPGMQAIRAPGRIALVLLPLCALAGVVLLQRLWIWGASGKVLSALLGALLVAENLPPSPPIVNRCEIDRPWTELKQPLCSEARLRDAGALLFLPMEASSFDRIFGQVPAMHLALQCGIPTLNGYSGRTGATAEPLMHPTAPGLACEPLQRALDSAGDRTGNGTLIWLEKRGPLGPPSWTEEELRACLGSCYDGNEQRLELPSVAGSLIWVPRGRACHARQ